MTDRQNIILEDVKFDEQGLVPAIIQDVKTREVLMLAYMNRESLKLTIELNQTHFYSRSRKEIWHKGATSGSLQSVRQVRLDCDFDTLLIEVTPKGPACHKGSYSCFQVEPKLEGFLTYLYDLIKERKETRPEDSYTTYLFDSGLDKILKKVGEETTEMIVASKNPENSEFVSETSDLLYHLMVLLVERGISLDDLMDELKSRHAAKPERN